MSGAQSPGKFSISAIASVARAEDAKAYTNVIQSEKRALIQPASHDALMSAMGRKLSRESHGTICGLKAL